MQRPIRASFRSRSLPARLLSARSAGCSSRHRSSGRYPTRSSSVRRA